MKKGFSAGYGKKIIRVLIRQFAGGDSNASVIATDAAGRMMSGLLAISIID